MLAVDEFKPFTFSTTLRKVSNRMLMPKKKAIYEYYTQIFANHFPWSAIDIL